MGLVGEGIAATKPGKVMNKRTAAGVQEGRKRVKTIMNDHPHWSYMYEVFFEYLL